MPEDVDAAFFAAFSENWDELRHCMVKHPLSHFDTCSCESFQPLFLPLYQTGLITHEAAARGQWEVLQQIHCMLDNEPLWSTTGTGWTVAHAAAFFNQIDVFRFLIGNVDLAGLIDHPNVFRQTPFMFAAQQGHVELVKWLLDSGKITRACDCHKQTAAHFAARNGHKDVLKALPPELCSIPDCRRYFPAHEAAKKGCIATMKTLHEISPMPQGPNIAGLWPIHFAAAAGFKHVVEFLGKHGRGDDMFVKAAVRVRSHNHDAQPRTPADFAAQNKHADVLETLAWWGDVAKTTFPGCARFCKGHRQCLSILAACGALPGPKWKLALSHRAPLNLLVRSLQRGLVQAPSVAAVLKVLQGSKQFRSLAAVLRGIRGVPDFLSSVKLHAAIQDNWRFRAASRTVLAVAHRLLLSRNIQLPKELWLEILKYIRDDDTSRP